MYVFDIFIVVTICGFTMLALHLNCELCAEYFGLLTLACFSMLIRMWWIFVIKNMSLLEWQLLWGVEKNDFKENVLCGCSICRGTLTLPFFWHGILECLFCTYNILYDSTTVISNSVIEYLGVFEGGFWNPIENIFDLLLV